MKPGGLHGNEAIVNVVICYTLGGSLKVLVTVHT